MTHLSSLQSSVTHAQAGFSQKIVCMIISRSDGNGTLGVEDEGALEAEGDLALLVLVVVAAGGGAEVAEGDGGVAVGTAVLEVVALRGAAVLPLAPRDQVHQQALEAVAVLLARLAARVAALQPDEVEGVLAAAAAPRRQVGGGLDAGRPQQAVRAAVAEQPVVLEGDNGPHHQALPRLLLPRPLVLPHARPHRGHLHQLRGRQLAVLRPQRLDRGHDPGPQLVAVQRDALQELLLGALVVEPEDQVLLVLLVLGEPPEVHLHLLLLQPHRSHVREGELQEQQRRIVGQHDRLLLVLLVRLGGREPVEDAVHRGQLLVPLRARGELQQDLVIAGLELEVGLLLGLVAEALPVPADVEVLEDAADHELGLVDAVVEVLLLALDDLVEIERAEPHRQLDGLVLVVVHDRVIVALHARLQQPHHLHAPRDVLQPHRDALETAQQEVDPQVQQVAERQEVLVRVHELVRLAGRRPLLERKGDAGEVGLARQRLPLPLPLLPLLPLLPFLPFLPPLRLLVGLEEELLVVAQTGVVLAGDLLVGEELEREGGDVVAGDVEGLEGGLVLLEEVVDELAHAGVCEGAELPLLLAGEGGQEVGHGGGGDDGGPERHVGPREAVDDLEALLLLVDEGEVERDLARRELVELCETGVAVELHLLELLLEVELEPLGGEQAAHEHALPHLLALLGQELSEGRGDEVVVEHHVGDQFLEVEHELVDQPLRVLRDLLVLPRVVLPPCPVPQRQQLRQLLLPQRLVRLLLRLPRRLHHVRQHLLHRARHRPLRVEVLRPHAPHVLAQVGVARVAEVGLYLVEEAVLLAPGEVEELVHLLAVGLRPGEGGVVLVDALLERDDVLDAPHLLADVVDLLAAGEEEGEDGVEVGAGDHLDALLLVARVVEHLLQDAVEPAVVEVRVLLRLQHQVQPVRTPAPQHAAHLVLDAARVVQHLLVHAHHRYLQLLDLPHRLRQVLLVRDEELPLHRDQVEHQLVVDERHLPVLRAPHLRPPRPPQVAQDRRQPLPDPRNRLQLRLQHARVDHRQLGKLRAGEPAEVLLDLVDEGHEALLHGGGALHLEELLRVEPLERLDDCRDLGALGEAVANAPALVVVEAVEHLRLHGLDHVVLGVLEVGEALLEAQAGGRQHLVGQRLQLAAAQPLQVLEQLVEALVLGHLPLHVACGLQHAPAHLRLHDRLLEALHVQVVVRHREGAHQLEHEVQQRHLLQRGRRQLRGRVAEDQVLEEGGLGELGGEVLLEVGDGPLLELLALLVVVLRVGDLVQPEAVEDGAPGVLAVAEVHRPHVLVVEVLDGEVREQPAVGELVPRQVDLLAELAVVHEVLAPLRPPLLRLEGHREGAGHLHRLAHRQVRRRLVVEEAQDLVVQVHRGARELHARHRVVLPQSQRLHLRAELPRGEELLADGREPPRGEDPGDDREAVAVGGVGLEIVLVEVLLEEVDKAGGSDVLDGVAPHHAGHQQPVVVEAPREDLGLGEEAARDLDGAGELKREELGDGGVDALQHLQHFAVGLHVAEAARELLEQRGLQDAVVVQHRLQLARQRVEPRLHLRSYLRLAAEVLVPRDGIHLQAEVRDRAGGHARADREGEDAAGGGADDAADGDIAVQLLERLVDAHVAHALGPAALEGEVEVALRAVLVPARQRLAVGVVHLVRLAPVRLLAQLLRERAHSTREEALPVADVDVDHRPLPGGVQLGRLLVHAEDDGDRGREGVAVDGREHGGAVGEGAEADGPRLRVLRELYQEGGDGETRSGEGEDRDFPARGPEALLLEDLHFGGGAEPAEEGEVPEERAQELLLRRAEVVALQQREPVLLGLLHRKFKQSSMSKKAFQLSKKLSGEQGFSRRSRGEERSEDEVLRCLSMFWKESERFGKQNGVEKYNYLVLHPAEPDKKPFQGLAFKVYNCHSQMQQKKQYLELMPNCPDCPWKVRILLRSIT